jgi:hypothetical protein
MAEPSTFQTTMTTRTKTSLSKTNIRRRTVRCWQVCTTQKPKVYVKYQKLVGKRSVLGEWTIRGSLVSTHQKSQSFYLVHGDSCRPSAYACWTIRHMELAHLRMVMEFWLSQEMVRPFQGDRPWFMPVSPFSGLFWTRSYSISNQVNPHACNAIIWEMWYYRTIK